MTLTTSRGEAPAGRRRRLAVPRVAGGMVLERSRALVAALAILAGAQDAAMANDTAAAFAAGGLVFQHSDTVRMVSEVLRISPSRIDVDYVFENTSPTDVTTTVAFPLPEIRQASLYYSPHRLPNEHNRNFLNFRVWVDGREVVPGIEVRAFLEGQEITETLKDLGVDAFSGDFGPPGVKKTLEDMKAIFPADDPDGEWLSYWTTRVTFHWPQVFPAGKRIHVRHTYDPAAGGGLVSPSATRKWCADEGFLRAFKALPRHYEEQARTHGDEFAYLGGRWVKYILTTGANWSGPIGHFTLVIDKSDADLVSTCPIPGLRLVKKGNAFTATATDYRPTGDLDILFANGRCPKGEPCR